MLTNLVLPLYISGVIGAGDVYNKISTQVSRDGGSGKPRIMHVLDRGPGIVE